MCVLFVLSASYMLHHSVYSITNGAASHHSLSAAGAETITNTFCFLFNSPHKILYLYPSLHFLVLFTPFSNKRILLVNTLSAKRIWKGFIEYLWTFRS